MIEGVRIPITTPLTRPYSTQTLFGAFWLDAPFAATYPLERNTRFARDRRQFSSKNIRWVRFARDRRQLFRPKFKNGRNARDSSTFPQPQTRKAGPTQSHVNPQVNLKTYRFPRGFWSPNPWNNYTFLGYLFVLRKWFLSKKNRGIL